LEAQKEGNFGNKNSQNRLFAGESSYELKSFKKTVTDKRMTMSKTNLYNWLRLLTAGLICSTALIACATGSDKPRLFSYAIEWNVATDATVYDKAEVKILDYSYGVADKFDIVPHKWSRDRRPPGGCCDSTNQGIVAPRGDYLYFKWRVLATGGVFEDRVDLSKRLPQDMNNRRLYIAIFGSQLYVYLFPPETTKESDGSSTTTAGLSPARVRGQSYQDTLRDSARAKKHQIYPSSL
jgi:hypothetical protein